MDGATRFWSIVGDFARNLAIEMSALPAGAAPLHLERAVQSAADQVRVQPAGSKAWIPPDDRDAFRRACLALAVAEVKPKLARTQSCQCSLPARTSIS